MIITFLLNFIKTIQCIRNYYGEERRQTRKFGNTASLIKDLVMNRFSSACIHTQLRLSRTRYLYTVWHILQESRCRKVHRKVQHIPHKRKELSCKENGKLQQRDWFWVSLIIVQGSEFKLIPLSIWRRWVHLICNQYDSCRRDFEESQLMKNVEVKWVPGPTPKQPSLKVRPPLIPKPDSTRSWTSPIHHSSSKSILTVSCHLFSVFQVYGFQ